jgi:hypothetical protein
MKLTFDQNLFTQTSLDSGSLNMLGALTHTLCEPGQYRGVVYKGSEILSAFYIVADKNSPVAQANIDLATLDPSVIAAPSRSVGGPEPGCCAEMDRVVPQALHSSPSIRRDILFFMFLRERVDMR